MDISGVLLSLINHPCLVVFAPLALKLMVGGPVTTVNWFNYTFEYVIGDTHIHKYIK